MGVSRVDITPPPGVQLAGYSSANRAARATLDPLLAQVITFDDGKRAAALVTLDLIFVPLKPEMEAIRERARRGGVQDVIFVASHTHSGPSFGDLPEWNRGLVNQVAQAITEARRKQAPARIGAGWGNVQIGFNRRHVPLDGPAVMWWRNETAASSFPVDPSVGVIRVNDLRGRPIAILANYACHPVVFGPDNPDYSADFPGEMRRTVEAAFPGAMAFFLQGGAGDINPYFDKNPLQEGAAERMRETGRKLGEEVVRAARQIQAAAASPSVGVKVQNVEFGYRYDPEQTRTLIERTGRHPISRYPLWGEPLRVPVTALVLNRQFAFAGMPGEPFVEFQMYLRAHSPLPYTYFLGYCNDNVNYVPTMHAAVRGGYGADNMITRIEVGAGEEMIHRSLAMIRELTGDGRATPGNPMRKIMTVHRAEGSGPLRARFTERAGERELLLVSGDAGIAFANVDAEPGRVRIRIPDIPPDSDLRDARIAGGSGFLRVEDAGGQHLAYLTPAGVLAPASAPQTARQARVGAPQRGKLAWSRTSHRFASPEEPFVLDTGVLGDICFVAISGEVARTLPVRFADRGECASTIVMRTPGPHRLEDAEPGAAAILADRAIIETFRLRGWLKPAPDLRY
ncbi:MAG: hypothetical protein K2X35_18895 [Bryobacteraceae bacterium]|nr:hypothetical protein [Bryobacteraceae bacterium]